MDSPRKVLHVLNGAGGGAALSTMALVGALAREGIESSAVCDDAGTSDERSRLAESVQGRVTFTRLYWWNRKVRARLWKRPLVEARQLWATGFGRGSADRVAEFATQQKVELIHTNTMLTPEGGIAARRLGLPHVWHLRELVGPSHPFRLRYEGPALGRFLALHCSKLIANSHVAAAQVRPWLPEGMLEVVPNGIDLAQFANAARRPGGERLIIGMVGSLSSRSKKHALFIEAAARLPKYLNVEWRIYGHDPSDGGRRRGDEYIDQLHDLAARLDVADRLAWPGFIDDPARIMGEIDILVHPAENESFGRVVVEAMAAGLPVVGARGGGVGEIVEDQVTGMLVTPNDPAAFTDAVARLAADSALRQTMGAAGRRRAENHYSLAACADGVLGVYRQAMARPLGPHGRPEEPPVRLDRPA